ncbi:MAG TPA: DUF445 family protein [Rubricoccaceae bacterium]|jgi:uncharacterized membrane-anchored protein YjiN (DUF445 family)
MPDVLPPPRLAPAAPAPPSGDGAPAFVPAAPVVRDADAKRAALARMKRIALGALVFAAAMFAALSIVRRGMSDGPAEFWVGFAAALFEAAMVGAFADWFAVTALFRHPMGIPIPHTAIIPEKKDRIGNALATFVGVHFLNPDNVMSRLDGVNFAAAAGTWLREPANVHRIRTQAVGVVERGLARLGDDRIGDFATREVGPRLREIALAPRLSDLLLEMTKDDRHEGILDEVLRGALTVASDNRDALRGLIRDRLPAFVPDKLVDVARDAVQRALETTLDEMIADRQHPLRLRVHQQVQAFVEKLEHDPEMQARVDAWRDRLLANEAVRAFVVEQWHTLRAFLARDLRAEDSQVFAFVEARAVELGQAMMSDPAFQSAVNEKVGTVARWAVERHGGRVPDLIRDTVARWNAEQISEQVELAVGRDLQFIRINGTVVGGLVGGVLYLLEALLG